MFKKNYPIEEFVKFIKNITYFDNNKYIYSYDQYKLAKYNNMIQDFMRDLEPYYYKSKQYFATQTCNYVNSITVIKQICRSHKIEVITEKKSIHSKQNIKYYILLPKIKVNEMQ
tara:strand:+ start:1167 stop:1508 length:342 start_codon:yes stop_codon:yes gene_type:complete